jgi:hypothetical protein
MMWGAVAVGRKLRRMDVAWSKARISHIETETAVDKVYFEVFVSCGNGKLSSYYIAVSL